ncbi:tyrosine-type recombinase/integrase [Actinopolymorpha sp. B17G11]|uniref:tyrosine-type recombinase/integrase n=1 Tax=Actinopolymorpha sp. B17G11 TaxID=3160861 RepID=UPI0032E44D8C
MSTPRRRRSHLTGITVYPRGKTWAYRVDVEAHPLTGKRRRENRGGFASEGEAWSEAIKAKTALAAGIHVKASRRTVRSFVGEWLVSIEHSVKPSTYVNYVDYLDAYVFPSIDDRRLQDVTVTVLNALYRHLLENGRCKPNTNALMYRHWQTYTSDERPMTARELAKASGQGLHAAKAAIRRYRAGRVPRDLGDGLSPKTVRNVQNMLHKAFATAVAWHYIESNPAEHVSKPRLRRRRPATWNEEQLGRFLDVASKDRFRALWVLVATTGMRRSELAGVERDLVDLDAGALTIEPTRVVVDGKPLDEDGKTDSGRRTISLDAYTVSVLREHLAMVDEERKAWGHSYPSHRKVFCFEDGRLLHPDTITRRFNRLVDRAGLPRITLHGVRHSYATIAMDNGINPKILSERIGHSSVGFTMQTYVQRSEGRDKDAAAMLARLIINLPSNPET